MILAARIDDLRQCRAAACDFGGDGLAHRRQLAVGPSEVIEEVSGDRLSLVVSGRERANTSEEPGRGGRRELARATAPPGSRLRSRTWRRFIMRVRWETTSSRRSESRRSTTVWSSTATNESLGL